MVPRSDSATSALHVLRTPIRIPQCRGKETLTISNGALDVCSLPPPPPPPPPPASPPPPAPPPPPPLFLPPVVAPPQTHIPEYLLWIHSGGYQIFETSLRSSDITQVYCLNLPCTAIAPGIDLIPTYLVVRSRIWAAEIWPSHRRSMEPMGIASTMASRDQRASESLGENMSPLNPQMGSEVVSTVLILALVPLQES